MPPDADRRIVSKQEYRALMREGDRGAHGFGATDAKELKRSKGTASYYATTPQRGLRMISLDTVAEGGGQNGNLDDPQYRWLKRELRKARRRDQLVVLFGHHTLETLSNTAADEAAGTCQPAGEPGCDADPRKSTPLHLGTTGKRSVKALLAANPNVIAYVAGHTHVNDVEFVGGAPRRRVLADQHGVAHRLAAAEPADPGDGQPRRHALDLRHDARQRRARGRAAGRRRARAVARPARLAQPHALLQRPAARGRRGLRRRRGQDAARARDRNVELLVRDPR